jgi:hypothetical protein
LSASETVLVYRPGIVFKREVPIPTDADIEKVKTNLTNMQAFNDYQYTHGNPLIANAYALLWV